MVNRHELRSTCRGRKRATRVPQKGAGGRVSESVEAAKRAIAKRITNAGGVVLAPQEALTVVTTIRFCAACKLIARAGCTGCGGAIDE